MPTKRFKKPRQGDTTKQDHTPGRPRPNRLREIRRKGVILSQKMLGKLVGLDEATVSRHESGQRGMTKEQIVAYASVFNVSTFEIFLAPEAEDAPPVKLGEEESDEDRDND